VKIVEKVAETGSGGVGATDPEMVVRRVFLMKELDIGTLLLQAQRRHILLERGSRLFL